ncbi:hypothetical protein NC651_032674 [Populus alba x Populus x berolinensis]|nr:hypothetical protein NC651_032674 [Populus alba x Populus x berolinensis]
MVGPLKFEGPCTAPVMVKVQGTLKAPADPKRLRDDWVALRDVEGLTVSGGGIFDGQGAIAWSVNNCAETGKCNSLPTVSPHISKKTCMVFILFNLVLIF